MLYERVETTSMEYDSTKYFVLKSYFRVKSIERIFRCLTSLLLNEYVNSCIHIFL